MKLNINNQYIWNVQLIKSLLIKPKTKKSVYEYKGLVIIEQKEKVIMPRKKFCSCGNLIGEKEKCPCKKAQCRPRADIERNKDITNTRWKTFRQLILHRDGHFCQRCLIKFNVIVSEKEQLEVHHIKPRSKYRALTYEATNCVTLCQQCNKEYGTVEQLDFDFTPAEIGNHYI